MLRNYFAVAFRNLLRNKLTAFINIAGLAVAIACGLLIFLFIQDELSYDRYNLKAARIYRMTREFLSPDGTPNLHLGHLAPPFGPLLKNDFADFEEVARTLTTRIQVTIRDSADQQKTINIENGYLAEPSLFNIFTVRITQGNPLKGFDEPYKIILSEQTALKLFGSQNPIGKPLRLFNAYESEVTGTFCDFPAQSFWHPSMFISFSTLNDSTIYGKEGLERNWGNNSFGTFVLVKEPFDPRNAEARFPDFLDRHMGTVTAEEQAPMPSTWTRLYMQKMTDIHQHSHLDSEEETNGNITNIYMMGVIGMLIILIACFNFINLSTARATKRSKEVGIRKVSGAFKNQLVVQFLAESVLVAFISLILATGISFFGLPWLEEFTSKSLPVFQFSNWPLFAGLILFTLIIGIIAGIYPAFVISGFKPVSVLKGRRSAGKAGIRKVLVTAQFAISVMLIIATAITYQQLNFLNKTQLGYDKNQVITLPLYDAVAGNYDAFYNEMVVQASIKNVSRSSRIPTGRLLDSMGG
ncbi:MAG TPA: ABC transporter permease, partial [Cyclobacteriaceae bacterium]|nr:ABC transporter permease [Cyclobacteriaceae bacterium]